MKRGLKLTRPTAPALLRYSPRTCPDEEGIESTRPFWPRRAGHETCVVAPHERTRSEDGVRDGPAARGAVARSAPAAGVPHRAPPRRGPAAQATARPVRARGQPGPAPYPGRPAV